ncbi:hypothetical protein T439DRAFT_333975 [Meredithblackwellia eburnea MCA 4105]
MPRGSLPSEPCELKFKIQCDKPMPSGARLYDLAFHKANECAKRENKFGPNVFEPSVSHQTHAVGPPTIVLPAECNQQTDHDSANCPRQGHYCIEIDENRYKYRSWIPRYPDFRWSTCPGQPPCLGSITTVHEHRKLCDHCFHDWRQLNPLKYEHAMHQALMQEQGGFSRHARMSHSTLRERCTPRSRWD